MLYYISAYMSYLKFLKEAETTTETL